MSVRAKMTAIADKIRTLLGISGTMGLDAMATNLGAANTTVDTQSALLNQAIAALEGKAAGGSGGSGGAFAASEEFIWTAPSDLSNSSGTIAIPHSLGVKPDGYHIMAVNMEFNTTGKYIMNNTIFDATMLYSGWYKTGFRLCFGDGLNNGALGAMIDVSDKYCSASDIKFSIDDTSDRIIIPAGKQYRVLVYKR